MLTSLPFSGILPTAAQRNALTAARTSTAHNAGNAPGMPSVARNTPWSLCAGDQQRVDGRDAAERRWDRIGTLYARVHDTHPKNASGTKGAAQQSVVLC